MPEKNRKLGFEMLLLSLILLMVVPGLIPKSEDSLLPSIFLMMTLLSSLYLTKTDRWVMWVASALVMLILLTNWPIGLVTEQQRVIANSALYIIFLGYICIHIFSYILGARALTSQLIYAALCMYLVMGLLWSFIYTLLFAVDPESIRLASVVHSEEGGRNVFSEMYYFSFVTLTTLGYGDILPVSRLARSLATMEAIVGQLYLAVVVASLVGIQISSRSHSSKNIEQ
jgi:voltage-gated potassium channel